MGLGCSSADFDHVCRRSSGRRLRAADIRFRRWHESRRRNVWSEHNAKQADVRGTDLRWRLRHRIRSSAGSIDGLRRRRHVRTTKPGGWRLWSWWRSFRIEARWDVWTATIATESTIRCRRRHVRLAITDPCSFNRDVRVITTRTGTFRWRIRLATVTT